MITNEHIFSLLGRGQYFTFITRRSKTAFVRLKKTSMSLENTNKLKKKCTLTIRNLLASKDLRTDKCFPKSYITISKKIYKKRSVTDLLSEMVYTVLRQVVDDIINKGYRIQIGFGNFKHTMGIFTRKVYSETYYPAVIGFKTPNRQKITKAIIYYPKQVIINELANTRRLRLSKSMLLKDYDKFLKTKYPELSISQARAFIGLINRFLSSALFHERPVYLSAKGFKLKIMTNKTKKELTRTILLKNRNYLNGLNFVFKNNKNRLLIFRKKVNKSKSEATLNNLGMFDKFKEKLEEPLNSTLINMAFNENRLDSLKNHKIIRVNENINLLIKDII